MKSFNAITYGGPGLPCPAVVVEFRASDEAAASAMAHEPEPPGS